MTASKLTKYRLARLFNPEEPFGPIDHALLDYSNAATAELCSFVAPLRNPIEAHSSIVIGRKGSGKSTFISTFEFGTALREQFRAARMAMPTPAPHKQLVLPLKTWALFAEIVRHLKTVEAVNQMPISLLPPEAIQEFWVELFWDEIIKGVYEALTDAGPLHRYVGIQRYLERIPLKARTTAAARVKGAHSALADEVFEEAIESVYAFLEENSKRLVVALDNFEKYPVRTPEYQAALQGFLRAVAYFNRSGADGGDRVNIVFAFPEEIESVICTTDNAYANVLKDTQRSNRIRWTSGNLWTVALHRYKIFLCHHDATAFRRVEDYNVGTRVGRRRFLDALFDGRVRNRKGELEEPSSYIIRHTQLLPRHLLTLLNGIAAQSLHQTGNSLAIQPDLVFEGVAAKENDIALDILTPYTWIFPEFVAGLKTVLPELESMFSYGELDKRILRFTPDVGLPFDIQDRGQIWQILFSMGIIGLEKTRDESRKYVEGVFQFNSGNAVAGEQFVINSQRRYCFHPLFSRHYGNASPAGETYCVYPAGIESIGRDDG